MSRLYLHCFICGRKQADGLISGAAWGKVEVPQGVAHPGVTGTTARACPSCMGRYADWQDRVLASLGLGSGFTPRAEAAG